MFFSALWFLLVMKIIIPSFNSGQYLYTTYRFDSLGNNLSGIITTIITNPLHVISLLITTPKIYFLAILFLSTGLISWLGYKYLIILTPSLIYLLLADYEAHYSYTTHYSAILLPTLFFATIAGLKKIQTFQYQKQIYIFLITIAFIESLLFGFLPFSRRFNHHLLTTPPGYENFDKYKKLIPAEASLSSQDNTTSHLSQRKLIEFYHPQTTADFIILDKHGLSNHQQNYEDHITHQMQRGYQKILCDDYLCLLSR